MYDKNADLPLSGYDIDAPATAEASVSTPSRKGV